MSVTNFQQFGKFLPKKSFEVPMVLSADFPCNLEKRVPPQLALKEGS